MNDPATITLDADIARHALLDAAEYREPQAGCASCNRSPDGQCDECRVDAGVVAQYREAAYRAEARVLAIVHEGCGCVAPDGISVSPAQDDRLRHFAAACRAAGLTAFRIVALPADEAVGRQLKALGCGGCRITPRDLARAVAAGQQHNGSGPARHEQQQPVQHPARMAVTRPKRAQRPPAAVSGQGAPQTAPLDRQ